MRPTTRSAVLMFVGIPMAAVPVFLGGQYWMLWFSYLAVLLVLMGIDGVMAGPRRRIDIKITAPEQMFIGRPGDLRIDYCFYTPIVPVRLDMLIETGSLLNFLPKSTLYPDENHQISTTPKLTANRRGIACLTHLWLRWNGPLGLMRCIRQTSLENEIPVVPDIQSVRSAALAFFGSREMAAGSKLEEFSGDGSEFDRLREFVPGLDHRSIDWKASARHNKLLSREFRAERNHQIIIAIDTGRLMSEEVMGIPKLDHSINSGLLLSWYSLRAGDRVGLFGFDNGFNLFRPPLGGVSAFPGLHLATAKLQYSQQETNFTLGLAQLATRLKQRSLVIVMTDFVDTIAARLMEDNLKRLSRKHLVLFVSLRNPQLESMVNAEPDSIRNMARSVVASDILQEREIVLMRLRRFGIQTIDSAPGDVSPELLNTYLEIKRRELIA